MIERVSVLDEEGVLDSVAELERLRVSVEEIDFWNEAFSVAAMVLDTVRDWLGSPERLLEIERLPDSVGVIDGEEEVEELGVGETGLYRSPAK